MCEKCITEETAQGIRKFIWDIPEHQLCTVVGSCLELNQLRKLKKRISKLVPNSPLKSDYDLHTCCVSICRSKNVVSRTINKSFNQQFAPYVKEIRSLKGDTEIRRRWSSRETDDMRQIAGLFWAIITCRNASPTLINEVYGDVHMISHISGRNSITKINEKNVRIRELELDLRKKDRMITRKNSQLDKIRHVSKELEKQLSHLSSKNRSTHAQISESQKSSQEYEEIINKQMNCMDRLQTRVDRQKQEILDLRKLLDHKDRSRDTGAQPVSDTTDQKRSGSRKENNDLFGKKILYVGGFARHRTKLQKLTEKINGCFLYHDGGVQQSVYQLDELVKRADAIFCPIDCISHNAIDRIKTLSKAGCKKCVFLRNASLSSFKRKVEQYAARN